MDYYKNWENLYRAASPEDREKSKIHWLKCHAENLKKENRNDLVIFSGKHLAIMAMIDNDGSY